MKRFTLILIALLAGVWIYYKLQVWHKDTFYQCTMGLSGDYVPRWYV